MHRTSQPDPSVHVKGLRFYFTAVGICCTIFSYIGPPMKDDMPSERHRRSHAKRHVHMTARDVLKFPRDYHAKGVLSLPYGNIVEPFEAWYSADHKMSRIDYYGGMDQTYQKESLGKHGFACKVVPEYSEITQKTYRGCLHRRGTERFPVKAQSIVPASHYFKYTGDVKLRGRKSAKWEHKFKIFSKVNTYILYTTKTKPLKPLRYEMMGYDTLLSSYYDHYVLDYEMFEPWRFNYTTLQIPTDLDCFDFSSKKFPNTVGELNPMLEFMPHSNNGAPFTLSHRSDEPSNSLEAENELDGRKGHLYGETKGDQNNNFVDSRPWLSIDDNISEDNSQAATHYPYLKTQTRQQRKTKLYSWHGIAKKENLGVKKTIEHSQRLGSREKNIKSSKHKHRTYKLFQKNGENMKHGRLLNSHRYANHRFYESNARESRKSTTNNGVKRRPSTESRSRMNKIFNSKTVRRKSKRKKKNHQKNKSTIGWKMSFKLNEALRRNYEEIVNVLFDAFKIAHEKRYSSHNEHETRKDIYRHNLRFIQSRNRMHLGYKLRSNHLMDMTDEEMHKHKGLLPEEGENISNGAIPFEALSEYFPSTVDWRMKGAVNSVRSQGICGSCYAYAVTGALEGAYFLKNGHLPDFSEQEIIDCSWGFGNRGCKSGYPHRAMQWILKHGGLAREANYGRYLAQEGYCHFQNVSIGVRVDSYMNISKGNVTELKQALAQYGPVSVLINTKPKSFKFYSSGIYYDPECSASNLDHAALAVGYGDEEGVPYWIIKNSWSKAWGEDGYIKIAQRNNNCGVTSKAVVVRIR